MFVFCPNTACPKSSNPFHTVSYYIEWVTTSWTYSSNKQGQTVHWSEIIGKYQERAWTDGMRNRQSKKDTTLRQSDKQAERMTERNSAV